MTNIELVRNLIKRGETFTFENVGTKQQWERPRRRRSITDGYAEGLGLGHLVPDDPTPSPPALNVIVPEYLAWRTQVCESVQAIAGADSPAARALLGSLRDGIQGNYEASFDREKAGILGALQAVEAGLVAGRYGKRESTTGGAEDVRLLCRLF